MSSIMINRAAKQAGDTIIEVMISIAIVALAIAIAYAISGKNLNVGITARERSQAVGLVQAQIERMNQAQQADASVLSTYKNDASKHFCFDVVNTTNNIPVANGAIDPPNNTLGPPNNDAGHYTSDASGSCISGGKYYLDIDYVPPGGTAPNNYGNSFAFTAKWYRLGGGQDQIVTIYYRPW